MENSETFGVGGGRERKRRVEPKVDELTGKIIVDEELERYCLYRSQGYGKSQAYVASGLSQRCKAESVSPMACELESRPYIKERIKQIAEERAVVALISEGKQEALKRWNDLFILGQRLGGKEGLRLMVDSQKQIDKINGHDENKKRRGSGDGGDTKFIDPDDYQEAAKKLMQVMNMKGHTGETPPN